VPFLQFQVLLLVLGVRQVFGKLLNLREQRFE
jgi:hypothetical protein